MIEEATSPLENTPLSKWEYLKETYFGDRPVIIAANRSPITFERNEAGDLTFSRGTGGLITALTGLARYLPVTWIACRRTEVDQEWKSGDVSLDEETSLNIRFLDPGVEAYENYYNVIANPLLWFLQHTLWDLSRSPVISRKTWDAWENGYKTVNQLFAKDIVQRMKNLKESPLVMLQDYHLYLTGRYIREQHQVKPTPTLMHFVHIPWPGPEYWRILPPAMRQTILDGLCAVDLLGFQTREDSLNFIRTVETYLPRVFVKYKDGRVWYRNHSTHVKDFPISIDVEGLRETAASQEVKNYRKEIQELANDYQLILRVDRIEPSKNILRGFQAFQEMLELHPEHLEKVKFLAILIPSRMEVVEYTTYLDDMMAVAGRINAQYGNADWEPIRILASENYPRAIAAMQCSDVLLVNAIADGMNLVAKEGPILNQKNGVLILSERAGAHQQLEPGALIISPCDVYATAEALHQALTMPPASRKEQADLLRWMIEREDIVSWLYAQLEAVKDLNL